MDPSEYYRIQALAPSHWWYQSLIRIAEHHSDTLPSHARLLDVGCGTGYLTEALVDRRVYGIDPSPTARAMWPDAGCHRVSTGSVERLPYASETFDLVCCFDVIYHRAVEDVPGALLEIQRVLKPGGRLVCQTAAFESLRNRHDDVVHTARRLDRVHLSTLLTDAGLQIETQSYRNSFAALPILFSRLLPTSGSNLTRLPRLIDATLRSLSHLEWSLISAGYTIPFGSSLFCVASKASLPIDAS